MKHILTYLIAIITTLAISSCKERKLPTPAISFSEDTKALTDKETNKWIDLKDHLDEPNTVAYNFNLKDFKYVTPENDTIQYSFSSENLLRVMITLNNVDYNRLLKKYRNDKSFTEIKPTFFKKGSTVIKIGKEYNKYTSLLYLNDRDKEISEIINQEYFQKIMQKSTEDLSNDHFYVQLMLSFLGQNRAYEMFSGFVMKPQYYYLNALVQQMY